MSDFRPLFPLVDRVGTLIQAFGTPSMLDNRS